MTPERWTELKNLLSLALKRPAAERAAVLAACGADADLRREAEELLACEAEMGGFLANPTAADDAAAEGEEEDDDLLRALAAWPRYELVDRLGRGGMAIVYKMRDPRLHRFVAVKIVRAARDSAVKRFLREAEAQARVNHDHVLKVFETGTVGPYHYIAMQYVDGPMLLGVREETSLDQKVRLMVQIADGLHAAHRHGLVHRDIKPGNILVERGGDGLRPYLVDFGLAADVTAPGMTETGVVMGTPRYMPPERIRGSAAAADRRGDVYSLGATFYELIAGTPAIDGGSGLEVLSRVLDAHPAPLAQRVPALPAEIDAIVMKCLEKDPQRRYPSALALAADLRRYLDGEPVAARPVGALARLGRRARRHPRLAAAFAVMSLAIVAMAVWTAHNSWRSARQLRLAQELGQEVRDVEWVFRVAQMAPVHSIEPERSRLRQRMARVAQTAAEVGPIGVGPGEYALGRGLLTLSDAREALIHLQRAWDAGYRTADAAMALGLAHSEIFRLEMSRAQRVPDDGPRAAQVRELERTHRDPALRALEEGRSSELVPRRYVDALIAAHRGDRRGAIAIADDAARDTPWLFEAPLLAGHLEFEDAVRLYSAGRTPEAGALAQHADRHYAEAQRVAPSSLDASLGRCAVGGMLLHMVMHRFAADAGPLYAEAQASCERALTLDSRSADAARSYSEAVRNWAGVQVLAGRDPGDAYHRAARLIQQSLAVSGENLDTLLVVADTFLDRAWAESRTGHDPLPAIDQALQAFAKARRLDPRNAGAINNMGQALLLRGRTEATRGLDALPSLDRAVATFEDALRIDPSLATGFRNVARTSLARADEQQRRGTDPVPAIEAVVRTIEGLPGDRAQAARLAALSQLRERARRD
jgi:eukaryotic-like serine/threonine-protein kinase